MKKNRLITAACGALLASIGSAQMPSPVHVQVPFDFTANGTRLSAGEYNIKTLQQGVVKIGTQDGKKAIMLFAQPAKKHDPTGGASLIFSRYGDRYFLSEVWGLPAEDGVQLPKSKQEKEYAAEWSARSTVRVVASQR